ncbi:hypothetical protein GDO86_019803 [Hymenochirus boettgeri]|uniref:Uncharacterized protein n=1 Tax=Hymenochirus boettgeri TaxID=247094 RepID=A0A8T2ILX2_9PIPI|nr:hypothetical protein GDO86_019803 [Hymenochirus boettgeri]
METSDILDYSLAELGNVETDFVSEWIGKEDGDYELDCVHVAPVAGDRLDSDDRRTVITESMSVTASDEEKLQLLNKNTDLRRLNAELLKLNQQWDEIYRNTTLGLQHTARSLQGEVQSLRQHIDKLSIKLEQEQHKREFYENSLLQEMKRNQKLQECVRQLENTVHFKGFSQKGFNNDVDISGEARGQSDLAIPSTNFFTAPPVSYKRSQAKTEERMGRPGKNHEYPRSVLTKITRGNQYSHGLDISETDQDVNQLKDQLKALRCQTEIYAADYKTEHTDRERIKAENNKLRQKETEMRELMLILQEQLKIYEDDFRKERSDKQLLQRLLKTSNSAREPALVHRCNNVTLPKGAPIGSNESSISSRRGSSKEQHGNDMKGQPAPYSIGY